MPRARADELTLGADVHFLRYYVGGDAVQPLPASGVRDCPQDYPAPASNSSNSSACVSAAPFNWGYDSSALPATAPIAIPTSEHRAPHGHDVCPHRGADDLVIVQKV